VATINIKYSQAVVDQTQSSLVSIPVFNGAIGTLVDAVSVAGYAVSKEYQYYSSWALSGTTLRLNFADGATEVFTGVVLDNPDATSGSATATGFEFRKDGLLTVSQSGTLRYDYQLVPSGSGFDLSLSPSATGSTVSALRLATGLATSDPYYDKVVGNVAIVINGAISSLPSGEISGTISKITATADKYLLSGVIEGNFQLSTNSLTAGQGLTQSTVTGVLTAVNDEYRDGSHAYITGISTTLGASQKFDETLFGDPARFGGDDNIVLDLPSHLYSSFLMASGDGNDRISIKGGGNLLNVAAGNGNDHISILGASHSVDGGSGLDVVAMSSARTGYTVQRTTAGYTIADTAGGVSTLAGVERIEFADATLALDIAGSGGQAYRLYQAALNRAPDAAGLGYWINALDKGTSLAAIADGFVNTTEFKQSYGVDPTNLQLVTQFYQNILHRAPEAEGLKYWAGLLDTKAASTAEVLASISESGENQSGLFGVIGNGFAYIPYG